jgi:NADH-quinone oxidoreductase subunit L
VPMVILAILSVIGGYLAWPGVYNKMDDWLSPVFKLYRVNGPALVPQPFYLTSLIVTLAVTAVGVLIAYQVYYRRSPSAQAVGAYIPRLYQLVYHRYYVDEIYDALFVRPVKFAGRLIYQFFEQDVVDAAVDGAGRLIRWSSGWMRQIQTGYVRNYALSILVGAVLIVGYYVFGGR